MARPAGLEIQELSPNLGNEETELKYPYIELLEQHDALALLLPAMPDGDLPILYNYEGVLMELKQIVKSALEIKNLLHIVKFDYVKSPEVRFPIENIRDIMRALE